MYSLCAKSRRPPNCCIMNFIPDCECQGSAAQYCRKAIPSDTLSQCGPIRMYYVGAARGGAQVRTCTSSLCNFLRQPCVSEAEFSSEFCKNRWSAPTNCAIFVISQIRLNRLRSRRRSHVVGSGLAATLACSKIPKCTTNRL